MKRRFNLSDIMVKPEKMNKFGPGASGIVDEIPSLLHLNYLSFMDPGPNSGISLPSEDLTTGECQVQVKGEHGLIKME